MMLEDRSTNAPLIEQNESEHVWLEGPKSRGFELWFAVRVFFQFVKDAFSVGP